MRDLPCCFRSRIEPGIEHLVTARGDLDYPHPKVGRCQPSFPLDGHRFVPLRDGPTVITVGSAESSRFATARTSSTVTAWISCLRRST